MIYLKESTDGYTSSVALINNTFDLIMGYVSTNIFHVNKQYSILWLNSATGLYDFVLMMQTYFQLSGGMLLLNNSFSRIAGCPAVDTSLVSLNLNQIADESINDAVLVQRNLV